MERGEFNDSIKNAFKDAEVSPSDTVWTNIELELEKTAGDDIRKRLFYYKMVAAASLIFAFSVGATTLYFLNSNSRFGNQQAQLKLPATSNENNKASEVATETDNIKSGQSIKSKEAEGTNASQQALHNSNEETENELNNSVTEISGGAGEELSSNRSESIRNPSVQRAFSSESGLTTKNAAYESGGNSFVTNQNTISTQTMSELKFAQRAMERDPFISQSNIHTTTSANTLQKKLKPTIFKVEEKEMTPDPGALLLAKLAEQERAIQAEENKKEKRSERVWTSLGVAAGSFSAVNANVSTAMMSPTASQTAFAQNVSVANQQAKASGSTYSVGVNVGTKITNRWIVQGGLNYMTQSCDYTANTVVTSADFQSFKVASYAKTEDIANQNVVSTASYEVNNSLQYVSVPIQAGYVLINRTISVQLNSGVSTDLFLQNTLTPQDGGLDKTTQQSGSDSPYRTVNFSGLVGTEISYKLGQHYRLALNPGIRYPFNSIYKSDVGVESTPLTFDIGLRFKYIFR